MLTGCIPYCTNRGDSRTQADPETAFSRALKFFWSCAGTAYGIQSVTDDTPGWPKRRPTMPPRPMK